MRVESIGEVRLFGRTVLGLVHSAVMFVLTATTMWVLTSDFFQVRIGSRSPYSDGRLSLDQFNERISFLAVPGHELDLYEAFTADDVDGWFRLAIVFAAGSLLVLAITCLLACTAAEIWSNLRRFLIGAGFVLLICPVIMTLGTIPEDYIAPTFMGWMRFWALGLLASLAAACVHAIDHAEPTAPRTAR